MTMERVVKVSEEHLWIGVDDQHVHLGLTNFIQSELGKIISVELPEMGDKIEKGEAFAEVESVSTVHELISPVSGTVLAVNPNLEERPSVINQDPYNERMAGRNRLKNEAEIDSLMDMNAYYHLSLNPGCKPSKTGEVSLFGRTSPFDAILSRAAAPSLEIFWRQLRGLLIMPLEADPCATRFLSPKQTANGDQLYRRYFVPLTGTIQKDHHDCTPSSFVASDEGKR
jgi:glycine cleavage system H protein